MGEEGGRREGREQEGEGRKLQKRQKRVGRNAQLPVRRHFRRRMSKCSGVFLVVFCCVIAHLSSYAQDESILFTVTKCHILGVI